MERCSPFCQPSRPVELPAGRGTATASDPEGPEVAYDEDLANRVRELLADEEPVTEMPMFGGLAFLVGGNMAVAMSSKGGLMVRVGPDAGGQALARPHAREVEMGSRRMRGWVIVEPDGLRTKRQLAAWVRRGVMFARSLPPKE
jgi:hypothetical protein